MSVLRSILLALPLFAVADPGLAPGQDPVPEVPLEPGDLQAAGRVAGVELTDAELELMLRGVRRNLASYERTRGIALDNSVAPALGYTPLTAEVQAIFARPGALPKLPPFAGRELPEVERPADLEQLAFADIPTLASLIRSRRVSCAELTEMYLARLERLDARLHCVISLCEERARAQAKVLDEELERGEWRGLLHGIPWGAKDLLAVRGTRTTWGAKPFEDQVIDLDATVVRRLDDAGAVLIAKLSLGALAWGDVWYGETTRNPWNPEQGSSGSSAGPASATAAGCVAFSIGSETLGSIVSPSARCGNSSLRPTFGRVSRHGAMALAWSMDKLGPICRSFTDVAIVFDAIEGHDPLDDHTVRTPPIGYADLGPLDVKGWKVGVLQGTRWPEGLEAQVRADLAALGCELVDVTLPDWPAGDLTFVLNAEAATAFDELTRSGRDDELVRQVEQAWPNVFRQARLIPAVEYLRACRLRRLMLRDVTDAFQQFDVLVHPHYAELATFNLTGHPSVCGPVGLRENGTPGSIGFSAQLFDEARLLAFAQTWQLATGHQLAHPELGD